MLNDLPTELLQFVVNNLDDADLIPLRLANQKLKDAVTPKFALAYFTTLKVFMSRHSLQSLNDICAHPIFGSHVRTINFASQRLLKCGLESVRSSVAAAEEDCRFMADTVDTAISFTLAYSLAYGEQLSMAESGEGILLLTKALDKLGVYKKPVGLGMVDSVWNQPEEGTLGLYTFGKDCFERYDSWNYWECARSSTLKTLLTAAYHSRCAVDQLSIKFENWNYEVPSGDELVDSNDPDMGTIEIVTGFEDHILANVCRGLRSFELKLLDSFAGWEGATSESIARILELSNNLQILHVDVGGASYGDFARGVNRSNHWEELELLTSALSTKRLREVYLTNCIVPQEHMTKLLSNNAFTFRALVVRNCCMSWKGAWSEFLRWILDNPLPKLDHLVFTDLYRELPFSGRTHPTEFIVAGTKKYEGKCLREDLPLFVLELDDSGF